MEESKLKRVEYLDIDVFTITQQNVEGLYQVIPNLSKTEFI